MDTSINAYLNLDSPTALIPSKALGRDVQLDAEDVSGFKGYYVDGTELAAMHRFDFESDECYELRCDSVRAAIARTVEHVGQLEQEKGQPNGNE